MAEKINVVALNENVGVPNKSEIEVAAKSIVERVEEGYMNPLLAYGQLTALEEMISQAKERVKPLALEEAERYEGGGKQGFGAYGCDFQVTETGVKYDYSENEYWRQLNEAVELAKAELKGHETTLKAMKQFRRTSTTTVKVSLHK